MGLRIFHVAGPGDIINGHEYWRRREHCPNVVGLTFSGQFEDFCVDVGAEAYLVSSNSRKDFLKDGAFTLEHRPKPLPGSGGAVYHLVQVLYGLGLLLTAVRYRADVALINSGTTYFFVTALFRLMGIRVIALLHNTPWPSGFPPTKASDRAILALESLFYRHVAMAVIGVSPECIRQVEQLSGGKPPPLYDIRAQYLREHFAQIPLPPPFDQRPFQIALVCRATRCKGIFDVLEMARKIEATAPGQVHWEICGDGPDLEELRNVHREMELYEVVSIRGWTAPAALLEIFTQSHAGIVPTRSDFSEGLAMTAAEAVLAGRPVITNPVVPALEVLRPACVEARTNDVDSYVEGVLKLISDRDYYESLRRACPEQAEQFYDRERGLTATLNRIVEPLVHQARPPQNRQAARQGGPITPPGA